MNEEDLFKINVATRQEIEEHLAFFKIVPRFNRVLECDLATHSWDYILTEDKSGFDEPTDVQPVEWVYYSGEISRFNDVNTLLIRGEYQSESMKHEIFLFHKMGLYPFEYGSCLYDDEIKVNQDSLLKDDTLSIQYPSCYSELEIMEPHDIRGDITRTMIDIRQNGDEYLLDEPIDIERSSMLRRIIYKPLTHSVNETTEEEKDQFAREVWDTPKPKT